MDPLIEGYLDYLLDVARKAAGTVRDVRCTLRRVSEAMERLVPDRPLWKLELLDYLRWIEGERQSGRGGASVNKNLSHLRGFLDYAWRSGRSDRNVLDGFQIKDDGKREEPESLSIEEAIQLVNACPTSTPTERRDRIAILLLYGCGLRTKELCDLRLQDVDTNAQGSVRAGRQGRSATDGAFARDGLYGVVGLSLGAWREARPVVADREAWQASSQRSMFAR